MQINRDNYENFFLLYVDGELCAADRKAVEEFAAVNADLQRELDILKETVLSADEILMEEKGELYRPVPIDALLQEKLLLKIDNELPENERASLNELIAGDRNVSAEFALLQRTKPDTSETIVFDEKHLLYRKERDNVVIGRFVRWAAAAILLGFGLFFGASLLNRTKTPEAVAMNKIKTGEQPLIKTTTNGGQQNDTENIASLQTIIKDQQKGGSVVSEKENNTAKNTAGKEKSEQPAPVRNTDNLLPNENKTLAKETPFLQTNLNNLPVPQKESERPQTLIAVVTPPTKVTSVTDNNIMPLETAYAKSAAFAENDKSENKILYMDEDDVKHSKAGGLFRKVKRFVERTAKIKTGNGLRIAGFEIAAK